MYDCYAPLAGCIEYEIGRFNVPGHDPMCSKHPDHIVGKNPLLPSFARFYLDMKIHYNVSENRILEMLRDMEAFMPQSSLNKWMHEIMKCLRERLQDLMLEVIKSSIYTNNDETRIWFATCWKTSLTSTKWSISMPPSPWRRSWLSCSTVKAVVAIQSLRNKSSSTRTSSIYGRQSQAL